MNHSDTDGLSSLSDPIFPRWFIVLVVVAVGALMLWVGIAKVKSAPMPFPKAPVPVPIPMTQQFLAGKWTMCWGDTRYPVTLFANGRYVCEWGVTRYVGSWGLDFEGRFWITESVRPIDAASWKSYTVRMNPGTLTGKIEVGAPGINFRLEKRRPIARSSQSGNGVVAIGAEHLKKPPRNE